MRRVAALAAVALLCVNADIGKSTYAMSHPFAFKTFMEQYFLTAENVVQANSTTECVEWVKLCLDVSSCSGPSPTVKQIHSVGAYERDSGSETMQELEGKFTQAVGNMSKYDPFMELAVGLFTSDLGYFTKAFDAASPKVPYFATSFTASGTTYYSVLVQVPGSLRVGAGSMLLIELVSKTAPPSSVSPTYIPFARFSAESLKSADQKSTNVAVGAKPSVDMLKVSFPSSDLKRDVQFFETVLKGTKVYQQNSTAGAIYAGKVLADDGVEIHFVESTQKTQGPMSVAEWETYQRELHSKCVGANRGFDRLADNHVGHSGMGNLDSYIKAVQSAGLSYRFYHMGPSGGAQFFYFYWPNGWGSQLIGTTSMAPTNVTGYNFCTQGIKGHCNSDLPSDDDEN